jgi:hypothetical protein
MRKRPHLWKTASILAVFVFLGITLFYAFPKSPEPTHQGKTATQWIDLLQPALPMRFADPKMGLATEAITNLGSSALPAIADILDPSKNMPSSLSPFRRIAIRLRLRPNPSPSSDRQTAAARAAAILAEKAHVDISPLAPFLIHHFTNGAVESLHGCALAHAGPAAIAFLTNYVTSSNQIDRLRGVAALDHASPEPAVFQALLRLSEDPSVEIAAYALSALSRHAPAHADVSISLALKSLHPTNDVSKRSAALDVFAGYKSDPRAREALAQSLSETNEYIRSKTRAIISHKWYRRIADPYF